MCLSMFLLQIIYFDSVQLLESMFIYLAKFAEVLTIISSRLAIISFFSALFSYSPPRTIHTQNDSDSRVCETVKIYLMFI